MTLVAVLVAVAVTAGQATATPTDIWVNDDASAYVADGTSCDVAGYASVQAAVDAAGPGTSIHVCPGTYVENVVVPGPEVTIASTTGPIHTTIQGSLPNVYVVHLAGPGGTLRGMRIVGVGTGDGDIGVFVGGSGATIARNVVAGGRIGVLLACTTAENAVAHNTIRIPADASGASGINVDTCEGTEHGSDRNVVHNNHVCGGTYPYAIAVGGESDDNVVHHNRATWIAIAGAGNVAHHNTSRELLMLSSDSSEHHNQIADVC